MAQHLKQTCCYVAQDYMLAGSVLLAACSHRATHLHSYCQAVCRAGVQAADLSAVMQAHRARIDGIEQAHAERMAAQEAKHHEQLEHAAAQHEAASAAQVHLASTSHELIDMYQVCLCQALSRLECMPFQTFSRGPCLTAAVWLGCGASMRCH